MPGAVAAGLLLAGCGDAPSSEATSAADSTSGSASSSSSDATTGGSGGADSSGEAESSSEDGAASSSSTDEGSTTGGAASCMPPTGASICGNDNSIVRGLATLPDGTAPAAGSLLVLLNHEYLGDGANGGVPHNGVALPGADFGAGAVPFELDMCANGEMWSEENCDYIVSVTLDLDADNAIDPGEPTGRASIFLSCTGDAPCVELVLDCTDGPSCLAFEDPPVCGCSSTGQSCNSPILAC